MYLKKNFIKSDQVTEELKKLKKEFRSWQRYSIFLSEKRESDKLNSILKEKNKNKFWRFVSKSKSKRCPQKSVTVDPSYLLDHYKKLFTESNPILGEDKIDISRKVNNFQNNFKPDPNSSLFQYEDLILVIKNLKMSFVLGHDRIKYSMIKNGVTEKFFETLLKIFNLFLVCSKLPSHFNISIIKPILKDNNKKPDDVNNIRPISISNCFAQIFESLILQKSPNLIKTSRN